MKLAALILLATLLVGCSRPVAFEHGMTITVDDKNFHPDTFELIPCYFEAVRYFGPHGVDAHATVNYFYSNRASVLGWSGGYDGNASYTLTPQEVRIYYGEIPPLHMTTCFSNARQYWWGLTTCYVNGKLVSIKISKSRPKVIMCM